MSRAGLQVTLSKGMPLVGAEGNCPLAGVH